MLKKETLFNESHIQELVKEFQGVSPPKPLEDTI